MWRVSALPPFFACGAGGGTVNSPARAPHATGRKEKNAPDFKKNHLAC
ncbi:hypothetical protein SXCC_03308 [Gluconacetobacter sp. SXCC-1]|nr:hypothetical protein SXCC_03308 [Gluconacetobacter sp. SXCC-1]